MNKMRRILLGASFILIALLTVWHFSAPTSANASYATSVVKSVQYGVVVISSTTTGTATITSVNTAKAVLIYLGQNSTINDFSNYTRLTLTNATTVTGTRASTGGTTITEFVVVEFF